MNRTDELANDIGSVIYGEEAVKLGLIDAVGTLADALVGADVLIGVSVANCVSKQMVASMSDKAIVFVCANPVPEINPQDALDAGAFIVGTGASQYKNQINNVLVFPGLFRGALDVGATTVSTGMMIAAANGIANHVSAEQLTTEYVLPLAYDKSAHQSVARAVAKAAVEEGIAKYPQNFEKLYK